MPTIIFNSHVPGFRTLSQHVWCNWLQAQRDAAVQYGPAHADPSGHLCGIVLAEMSETLFRLSRSD